MGDGMNSEFQQLLNDRKILRARVSRGMVLKEMQAAQTDLQDARDSLQRRKFKWATIQGYYSMFHSARALLYSRGFRERSHYALFVAIRNLLGKQLGNLVNTFEEGMELRQEADYGLKFSEEGATETVEGAEEFLKKAKALLKT